MSHAGGQDGVGLVTEALQPTEDDVRQELGAMIQEVLHDPQQNGNLQHKLMAITMLCMLPGYELRALDFLQPAFQEFKDKASIKGKLSTDGLHHPRIVSYTTKCLSLYIVKAWPESGY